MQKKNWCKKYLMHSSWIHHLLTVREEYFEWKMSTSSYLTESDNRALAKKQDLHQGEAIQIYFCLTQSYGLFYKFLYCQTHPSTYVSVFLRDCTVILQKILSCSTAKVVTETKGTHNFKRLEEDSQCMSISLILVNVSMQKWKRIVFQRQKKNLTEI